MEFLYFLEKLRTPVCDAIFSFITHGGEELVFLVVAILFFWCINKREGYYILTVGLVGTVINQAAKLTFRIDRPWVKDPSFTVVGDAKVEAGGYSFPSGHTQNATGTFGSIARFTKSLPVRIISIALIVLIAFSRMYLGVHTPLDVGVSLIIGALLVFLLHPIFESEEHFHKFMPYVVAASAVLAIGLLLFVFLLPTEGIDEENLYSGMKNAATLFGCTVGLVPVYFIDRKYINFRTDGKWYAQILKLSIGLAVILLIKSGLSAPLVALFGNEFVARGVRYLLIVLFAGCVWPLTFNFWSRLSIPFIDRLFCKNNNDKTVE